MADNVNVMTFELRADTEQTRNEALRTISDTETRARALKGTFDALAASQRNLRETVLKLRESYAASQAAYTEQNQLLIRQRALIKEAITQERNLYEQKIKYEKEAQAALAKIGNAKYAGEKIKLTNEFAEASKKVKILASDIAALRSTQTAHNDVLKRGEQDLIALGRQRAALLEELRRKTVEAGRAGIDKSRASADLQALRDEAKQQKQQLRDANKTIAQDDRALAEDNKNNIRNQVIEAEALIAVYNRLTGAVKGVIVDSVLYAARTLELDIALKNVAKTNGINTGSIKVYESAIKSLNITTQRSARIVKLCRYWTTDR